MSDIVYTEMEINGNLEIVMESDINLFNINQVLYLLKNSNNKKIILNLTLSNFIDSAAINKLALLQHRFKVEARELVFKVNDNYRTMFKYFQLI